MLLPEDLHTIAQATLGLPACRAPPRLRPRPILCWPVSPLCWMTKTSAQPSCSELGVVVGAWLTNVQAVAHLASCSACEECDPKSPVVTPVFTPTTGCGGRSCCTARPLGRRPPRLPSCRPHSGGVLPRCGQHAVHRRCRWPAAPTTPHSTGSDAHC